MQQLFLTSDLAANDKERHEDSYSLYTCKWDEPHIAGTVTVGKLIGFKKIFGSSIFPFFVTTSAIFLVFFLTLFEILIF